jgi:hypothetical protein
MTQETPTPQGEPPDESPLPNAEDEAGIAAESEVTVEVTEEEDEEEDA